TPPLTARAQEMPDPALRFAEDPQYLVGDFMQGDPRPEPRNLLWRNRSTGSEGRRPAASDYPAANVLDRLTGSRNHVLHCRAGNPPSLPAVRKNCPHQLRLFSGRILTAAHTEPRIEAPRSQGVEPHRHVGAIRSSADPILREAYRLAA